MNVVLDTNVYVAACFGGHAAYLMHQWEMGAFRIVLSPSMRVEHETILQRHPRANPEWIEAWNAHWSNPLRTEILSEDPRIEKGWCKDSTDDKFIAAAIAGNANYLITADKMLLTLVQIEAVEILQVRRFIDIALPKSGESFHVLEL